MVQIMITAVDARGSALVRREYTLFHEQLPATLAAVRREAPTAVRVMVDIAL